jgi:aspartyl-tRNA(Asn)/glutamyl-tRNA(Gln) amidotransferase subunit B
LAAQQILEEMFKTGSNPIQIMKDKNLAQVSDSGEIETIIDKIISTNPKAVEDFKTGKEASFKFLVGMAMREAKGKANPAIINELLLKKLK